MNEWEAKYRFLSMGIEDSTCVENAEKACEAAIGLAVSTGGLLSFDGAVWAMVQLIGAQQSRDAMGKFDAAVESCENDADLSLDNGAV